MRQVGWVAAMMVAMLGSAAAGDMGDQLPGRLYDGNWREVAPEAAALCEKEQSDACFAAGLFRLVGAYEDLAQSLYRHGATDPGSPGMALLLGMDTGAEKPGPANPDPEPLRYQDLRAILEAFQDQLTSASALFEQAGNGESFVITIDPFQVRVDLDGNGTAGEGETLALLVDALGEFAQTPYPDGPPPEGKVKRPPPRPDTSVGFDNADAIWLAGYSNIVAAPVDLLLAHDFSAFFDAYLHRVFPKAGLPMQDHSEGGMLFMDASSDAWIADLVAAIHTSDFPVADAPRLAGVLERLRRITALSRRNWELILAEDDDNQELVPSPRQTSIVPSMTVTQETVDAWLATLDTVDRVLAGELLVPHWRFEQGFDLEAYFTAATETDIVMLMTGQGALPFLRDGPVADALSFAEASETLGADWLSYAFWFN